MKKKLLSVFVLCTILASNLSGCQIGDTEYVLSSNTVSKKVLFTINEQSCSEEEYKLYLANYKNLYGTAYGIDLWNYDFGEDSLHQYTKDVALSELTRIVCMDLIAKQREITLSEEEVKTAEKAAKEYYSSLTEEEKNFIGASESNVSTYYEHYALAKKLYQSLTSGNSEEISEDEARVVRVLQIYVTTEKDANDVVFKLNNGEDFATVASAYDESQSIETTVARGTYPKEVEDVLFNLDNNQESGKIAVDGGYYFFRCVNKLDEELTKQNKETILENREKKDFEDGYANFIDEAVVDLNQQMLDAIDIDSQENIVTDSFFAVYDKYFQ